MTRLVNVDEASLPVIAAKIRGRVIEMVANSGAAHLASALSCVDILVAAYWKILHIDAKNPGDPLRDRFILSKGHAASALYAVLAERGFFSKDWLESFGKYGAPLAEQPAMLGTHLRILLPPRNLGATL